MVSGSHQPPISQRYALPSSSDAPAPAALPLPYNTEEMDLQKMTEIVYRRRWMLAGVAIATTVCFWGWTLTRTPIYRGEFQVLVEAIAEVDPSQDLLRDGAGSPRMKFDYDTQTEVLRSPALLRPILEQVRETYPDFTYSELAGNLSITRLRETKVLSVSYRNPDPERIQTVLDAVADAYLQYSFEQRQTSLQQGVQFVEGQLPELRDRVNSLQQRLERFRQEYSLIDPESRGVELSRLITSIEEQQQSTQTQLSEAESLYLAIQSQLGYSPDEALAASALSESGRYQAILNEIQQVEAQIATESARFLPDTPNVQVLEDRRDSLLPLLEQEANRILGQRLSGRLDGNLTSISIDLSRQLINTANEVQVLQTRQRALAEVEQRIKQEFDLVPALARQYTDLQRELSIATDSLNRFLTTRESLQLQAAQQSIPWQLISEPTTGGSPIAPNVPRSLMLGAIAGLLIGAGAAVVTDKLDTVFHTPDDLKAFARLPMLGVVPFVRRPEQLLSDRPDISRPAEGQGYHYQSTPFLEAFRSLYTNIRFLGVDRPIRSVVISSAVPAEGKSTIALNLARSAAIMGQRVLLVDADLRLPQVHERLRLANLKGLSNVLTDDCTLEEALQRSPIDENLTVITAGMVPPDPIQLLSSQKMQQFNHQAIQDFDLVIYDMPPLLGFADSSLLAAQTDGMIVVVGLGNTARSDLKQALDTLDVSPVVLLGVVANGVKAHTTRAYGYNRYHHYYKAYAEGTAIAEPPKLSWMDGMRQRFQPLSPNAPEDEPEAIAMDEEHLPDAADWAAPEEQETDAPLENLPRHLPIPSILDQEDETPYRLLYEENHNGSRSGLSALGPLMPPGDGGLVWDDDPDVLPDLTPGLGPVHRPWMELDARAVDHLSEDLSELEDTQRVPEAFDDGLTAPGAWLADEPFGQNGASTHPEGDLEGTPSDRSEAQIIDELMQSEVSDETDSEQPPANPLPSWLQKIAGRQLLSALYDDLPLTPEGQGEDPTAETWEAPITADWDGADQDIDPVDPINPMDPMDSIDAVDLDTPVTAAQGWDDATPFSADSLTLSPSTGMADWDDDPIDDDAIDDVIDDIDWAIETDPAIWGTPPPADALTATSETWLDQPARVDATADVVQSALKSDRSDIPDTSEQTTLALETPQIPHPPRHTEDSLEVSATATQDLDLSSPSAVDTQPLDDRAPEPSSAAAQAAADQPAIAHNTTHSTANHGDLGTPTADPQGLDEEQAIADLGPRAEDTEQETTDSSPFFTAILIAQQAIAAGQQAESPVDWLALADHWQQASDLMGQVSPKDEQYAMAQQCQDLYQRNSDYARSRAIH
jgi:succinoglycan biosynthesis transport protein ExoP